MTYSNLRNKFINWSSIINQKSKGQSQQAWDMTYKLGHTGEWNTNLTEPQRSSGKSLDFTSCDSPEPKIFTESHLDRPECLCQL